MTTTQTDTPQLNLPVTVHVLNPLLLHVGAGSLFGDTRACGYGTELEVTAEVIGANTDRLGGCWLRDWLATGEDTYVRDGQELLRRGPWPEGTCRHQPGTFEWQDARDRDLKAAHAIEDPAEREARRQWVRDHYGAGPVTSRTLFHEPGQVSR